MKKNDEFLKLEGDIIPLTAMEENQLKGGFGAITTSGIGSRATNGNCTSTNKKEHCSNSNCVCNCKPTTTAA